MKKNDAENIEQLNRDSFINNYLTQKLDSLNDPLKLFHFIRKPFIFLALVISSQILDTFNNILLFLSLVYLVFEFGYKVDKKYKIVGTIFFVIRLFCGIYFGYSLSLYLSFAGKISDYTFNNFLSPKL